MSAESDDVKSFVSSCLSDQPNASLYHLQSAASTVHLDGRMEFESRTLEDLTRFSLSLHPYESVDTSLAEYQQARLRRGIMNKKLSELIKPNERVPSKLSDLWGLRSTANMRDYLATVTWFLPQGPDSTLYEFLEYRDNLPSFDGVHLRPPHMACAQLMTRLVHPFMLIPVIDPPIGSGLSYPFTHFGTDCSMSDSPSYFQP